MTSSTRAILSCIHICSLVQWCGQW